VVVQTANQTEKAKAQCVVEPLQGYLHRMKKILAMPPTNNAYRLGSHKPNGRGTGNFLGSFNFFTRLDKDHEKTTLSPEAWVPWQTCQIIHNRLA
jgi:hypothetical protein